MNIKTLILLSFCLSSCGSILDGENLDLDILFANNCESTEALYLIGGNTSSFVTTDGVYKSTNGISWNLIGTLPQNMTSFPVVFNGQIWLIGGLTDNGVPLSTIYSSSDGVTWTLHSQTLPVATAGQTTVFNGKIWVFGLLKSGYAQDTNILYSSDGLNFTQSSTSGDIASANGFGTFFPFGGNLFFAGGMNILGGSATEKAYLSADGITWSDSGAGDFNEKTDSTANGFHNGLLIAAGGVEKDTSNNATSNIRYTSNGTSWTDVDSVLSVPVRNANAISFKDSFWIFDGDSYNGSDNYVDTIQKSSNGLSTYTSVGSIPKALVQAGVVKFSEKCRTGTNGTY